MPSERSRWNTPLNASDPTIGTLGASNKTFPFMADYCPGSVQVVGTGTPTGTPTLFCSNNHDPANQVDKWNGTWESVNALLETSMVAPAGAGFQYFLEFPIRARAFYFDYSRSGGAGGVEAVFGKES